jgi:hypothetical protein
MAYLNPRTGMGASTAGTIESVGGSTLASVAGTLAATGAITGPAAPVLLIAAGIAEFLGAMGVGSGCGQTCVLSSQYANQAEALLKQNIAAYFAINPPRPQSAQTAGLTNFDTIWSDLDQQCSNAQLGAAGQRCITDRQAGGCTWKASPPEYPGEPAAGDCWNWFNAYRDPIANDPDVVPDSELTSASSATGSTSTGASVASSPSSWLLIAAAAALVVWGLS